MSTSTTTADPVRLVRRGEGERWRVGGEVTAVTAAETHGTEQLLVLETEPTEQGPTLSRHRFVEAFHVLAGEVELVTVDADGHEQVVRAGVGDTALVESLAWHSCRAVGGAPARVLTAFDDRAIQQVAEVVGERLPDDRDGNAAADHGTAGSAPSPEQLAAVLPLLREHQVEQHWQAVAAGTAVGRDQPGLRVVRAGDGARWLVGGEVSTVVVSEDDEAGRLLLVESTLDPGAGPAPARHLFLEAFHVLEGEVEFTVDDDDGRRRPLVARVGDTVTVPSRAWHGYRNTTDRRARLLVVFPTPEVAELAAAVGTPVDGVDDRPDPVEPPPEALVRAAALMERLGIEMTAPPPIRRR